MEYLLNYIEDYELEDLKEIFTDEIIQILTDEKDSVSYKIEELLKNGEEDIFMKLSQDIEYFI